MAKTIPPRSQVALAKNLACFVPLETTFVVALLCILSVLFRPFSCFINGADARFCPTDKVPYRSLLYSAVGNSPSPLPKKVCVSQEIFVSTVLF